MIDIIYYAHAMAIYNSEREKEEIEALQVYFLQGVIYNPNRPYIEWHKSPMKACFRVVKDTCITGLAFSGEGDFVSMGVYAEIRCAQKRQKPVYRIKKESKGYNISLFSRGFEVVGIDKKTKWAKII